MGARQTPANRRAEVSALGALFWGEGVGSSQVLIQMDDKKAADLVGMVSRSPRELDWGVAGVGRERSSGRSSKSPEGGGGQTVGLWGAGLPGRILLSVFCTSGSGYMIRLVVWKVRSGGHVCSHMHTCTRVRPCLHPLLAPNSPENGLVSFSEVHRNPGAADAVPFWEKDAGVRLPAPG